MAILRISPPTASTPGYVPDIETDYNAQNDMLQALALNIQPQIPLNLSSVVVRGTILNAGGVLYRATADTPISGGSGIYVELVPTPDGSELIPQWTGSIGNWNSEYQGFYSAGGNLILSYSEESATDIQTDFGAEVSHTNGAYTANLFTIDKDTNDFFLRDLDTVKKVNRYANRATTVTSSVTFLESLYAMVFHEGNLYVSESDGGRKIRKYVGFSNTRSAEITCPINPQSIMFLGDDLVVGSTSDPGGTSPNFLLRVYDGFSAVEKYTILLPNARKATSGGAETVMAPAIGTDNKTILAGGYNYPITGSGIHKYDLLGNELDTRYVTYVVGGFSFNGLNYYFSKSTGSEVTAKSQGLTNISEVKFFNSLKLGTKVNP